MSKKWMKEHGGQQSHTPHEAPKESTRAKIAAIKHPVGSQNWLVEAIMIIEAALAIIEGTA